MTTRPNIILINCDDLGYGDLGCYGSARNQTPHLDALALGGMRFTDFYVASPVCSASRAGLMTGCYPQRIGFAPHSVLRPGDPVGLSQDETTIASLLGEAGYATKIVGKWHCGDQPEFLPTRHGFDEYFGIPFSNDMGRQVGHDGILPETPLPPLPLLRNETVIQEQPDQRGITERYAVESLQFIHANRERPFFLYLAHMYVHVPLFVSQRFLTQSRNGAYGGAVECIDWCAGLIVDQLKQLGLFENTLIIFTSDNGSRARDEGGSNAPCRGTKGTTWEGGQRVPCIMHWPAHIQPESTCSHIVRSIDLLPTLTRIAGSKRQPDLPIDGCDLGGYLKDTAAEPLNDRMAYYLRDSLEAVRIGRWKLHFHKGNEPLTALYNLEDDIAESHDVRSNHPRLVAELEAYADTLRSELGDSLRAATGAGIRPIGRVESPKPLTEYRAGHPYMIAAYDLPDMPTMAG